MIREILLNELVLVISNDVKIFSRLFYFFLTRKMNRCAAVMLLATGIWYEAFKIVNGKRMLLVVQRMTGEEAL